MMTEKGMAVHRAERYAHRVIAPAVFGDAVTLEASVWQTPDAVDLATATAQRFTPVEPGWRWGPAWSTAWFHLRGTVPTSWAGRDVALRFDCGTEALWWDGGAPRRGFDRNRDAVTIFEPAAGGEPIEALIEAACNHPFGTIAFDWDPPETQARWEGATPGLLSRCELAVFRPEVWDLYETWTFVRALLAELPDEGPRPLQLIEGLRAARRCLDDRCDASTAIDATHALREFLECGAAGSHTRCFAVGHAHIDTAWLWPLRETRRKCLRSFANVLELIDRTDEFSFMCSQPQQYAWVEQDAPALFDRIRQRVADGRWEPVGAMWIEPDGNVPSGESFIRQILHGERYWRERFGERGRQRLLYLPDTFGFSPVLPQIMAGCGLDTFITNKLSWNEVNAFPYTNFRWRGLDGTTVLAHCTPGHDYNAANTPLELRRGERNASRSTVGRAECWLQPFGYGDGGGGPTPEMVRRAELSRNAEGVPWVQLRTVEAFCDALHWERAGLRGEGRDFPVWDGELYLELHRGTLTTQAWLKRANRRAEDGLRMLEWLRAAAPRGADSTPGKTSPLDAVWKLVLLNQFHDILPGSSIGPVYDDARAQYEEVETTITTLRDEAAGRWAADADTRGIDEPCLVLNPGSVARRGVVEHAGSKRYVDDVPALGARVAGREKPPAPVTVDGTTLDNGILRAVVDAAGRVTSLLRHDLQRDAVCVADDPLHQLVLYEDRPASWEAWDIDDDYVDKADPLDHAGEVRVETDPLRSVVEIERSVGDSSRIVQRFRLDAGSLRLDIETRLQWHEQRRLLRALFPVPVRATRATYDVGFGFVERATHANTSYERARFEACAHRWMDLSEPGFGVALLNDCKYGHSCHEHVMGLSLARGPLFPDPDADQGTHVFTYALMPHAGCWRSAGVDHEAAALNTPLLVHELDANQSGAWTSWAPVEVTQTGAAGVMVAALKPAEDDERLVLRLVETRGGAGSVRVRWHVPVDAVVRTDLLERTEDPVAHAEGVTTLDVRPFEIVTLAATRA